MRKWEKGGREGETERGSGGARVVVGKSVFAARLLPQSLIVRASGEYTRLHIPPFSLPNLFSLRPFTQTG